MSEDIIGYDCTHYDYTDPNRLKLIRLWVNQFEFIDQEHKNLMIGCMLRDNTNFKDQERISLFYLLTLHPVSREHLDAIYDFKDHSIHLDCFNQSWQTHSSAPIIAFAFNLYNNYQSEYTILDVFHNAYYLPYFYEAINLRIT